MEGKSFKLLEDKIVKMISLMGELRKERDSLQEKIKEKERQIEALKGEIENLSATEDKSLSSQDVRKLLEITQEERMMLRDSIRGALRLIKE
ncbi:MAG: hypothetical protein AB1756_02960 [Acidobacteriota bacterium]